MGVFNNHYLDIENMSNSLTNLKFYFYILGWILTGVFILYITRSKSDVENSLYKSLYKRIIIAILSFIFGSFVMSFSIIQIIQNTQKEWDFYINFLGGVFFLCFGVYQILNKRVRFKFLPKWF